MASGPKPFSFLLDKTVTVQRNTPTKDAAGGQVDSWANLSGAVNVKASNRFEWRTEAADATLHRRDGLSEYLWAFESDLGVRVNDRIVYAGKYYAVIGNPDSRSNEGLAEGPYIVKTVLRSK